MYNDVKNQFQKPFNDKYHLLTEINISRVEYKASSSLRDRLTRCGQKRRKLVKRKLSPSIQEWERDREMTSGTLTDGRVPGISIFRSNPGAASLISNLFYQNIQKASGGVSGVPIHPTKRCRLNVVDLTFDEKNINKIDTQTISNVSEIVLEIICVDSWKETTKHAEC